MTYFPALPLHHPRTAINKQALHVPNAGVPVTKFPWDCLEHKLEVSFAWNDSTHKTQHNETNAEENIDFGQYHIAFHFCMLTPLNEVMPSALRIHDANYPDALRSLNTSEEVSWFTTSIAPLRAPTPTKQIDFKPFNVKLLYKTKRIIVRQMCDAHAQNAQCWDTMTRLLIPPISYWLNWTDFAPPHSWM